MPNSSGGQQEVKQQEDEEGGVGEGAREQELEQQDDEQVVKRRIAVSRTPTSRMTSVTFRFFSQTGLESYSVPVKVNTITVASEERMLRQVAFTEKVISTSFCVLRLLQQHFTFDSNVKKVKAGKSE